jgi:hypothetical protein
VDDRGSIPGGGRNFCLRHCVHTGSESHPALCPVATEGDFPRGVKWPGRETDHSQLHLVRRLEMRGAVPPFSKLFHYVMHS